MTNLDLLRRKIAEKLCEIEPLLASEYVLTLFARHSTNVHAHCIITNEKKLSTIGVALGQAINSLIGMAFKDPKPTDAEVGAAPTTAPSGQMDA